MAKQRLTLAAPNWLDSTVLYTPSVSGGSWRAALPASNIRSRPFVEVARSSDLSLAATQFDIDLQTLRLVGVLAVPYATVTTLGKIRYRVATDSAFGAADTVYDSGWLDYWPVLYPLDSLAFEDVHWWDGRLTEEERVEYPLAHAVVLSSQVVGRYVRIEFSDASNSDGYLDVGRVVVAPGYQTPIDASLGLSLGWQTDTLVQPGFEARFFDRRSPRRVARFTLPYLPQDDALSSFFEIMRTQGVDREVLLIIDPGDTVHRVRRTFLCRMTDLQPLVWQSHDRTSIRFELEEIIA